MPIQFPIRKDVTGIRYALSIQSTSGTPYALLLPLTMDSAPLRNRSAPTTPLKGPTDLVYHRRMWFLRRFSIGFVMATMLSKLLEERARVFDRWDGSVRAKELGT